MWNRIRMLYLLESMIKDCIEESQGVISFRDFMEKALYAPGLGYYESARVFGEKGDFVTAPDLGRWLARALCDMLVWQWHQLGKPKTWTVLEQGGGKGVLLCQVHRFLRQTKIIMPSYIAIEKSQYLRQQQNKTYKKERMKVQQFRQLSDVPSQTRCVLFCNELLDAFPVQVFQYSQESYCEMGVACEHGQLVWQKMSGSKTIEPDIDSTLTAAWPEGYQSEWNPAMADWLSDVNQVIQQGFVLCIDYGYTQAEYYRPQRKLGSLLAHYRHQTNEDFFQHIGQQDLTAHVDFSALHRHAHALGWETLSFLSQTAFLAQSPSVQEYVGQIANSKKEEDMQEKAHLQRLVHPFQMGEVFKLCMLAKDLKTTAPDYLQQFQSLDKL